MAKANAELLTTGSEKSWNVRMLLIAKRAICRGILFIFFQNESTPKVGPETADKIEGGPKRPIGRPALASKRAAK